jgi:uncharacterized protein YkwD
MGNTTRRRALAGVASLLLAAVVLSGCLGPEAQSIFDKTNATRTSLRIRALTEDTKLDTKAQALAESMARQHKIFHSADLRSGVPAGYTTLGENVAVGPTIDAVYSAWLRSSGHYANIVNKAYSRIGVGVAKGSDGQYYAAQDFWG